jgi:hypothetical protein
MAGMLIPVELFANKKGLRLYLESFFGPLQNNYYNSGQFVTAPYAE